MKIKEDSTIQEIRRVKIKDALKEQKTNKIAKIILGNFKIICNHF
jgi:hypothetical protein